MIFFVSMYTANEMKKDHVIVTPGCGLKNVKHIIHIVSQDTLPRWGKVMFQFLEVADGLGIESLAVPAMGTGMNDIFYRYFYTPV